MRTYDSVLIARPMSPFHDAMDDQSDTSSIYSGSSGRMSQGSTSSATTQDIDMRPVSPSPSLYSMTDSLIASSYRQEYGRNLNAHSDVYRLPADEEEIERLNKQHEMFKKVMGKYPPPLDEVLRDNIPGEPKRCLDLGCGSGSWIIEVARDYPGCQCLAVDLVPMQNTDMPENCRSEVDDINLGLQHYYGDFDVVHTRLICTGITDYAGLVDQMVMTLRPRGLLDMTEYNFLIYDHNKKPITPNFPSTQGPYLPQWMHMAQEAIRKRGADVQAAHHLHNWVTEHPDLSDISYTPLWFQASPWKRGDDPATQTENEVGEVMREDLLAFMKAGRPLLLGTGFPEHLVNIVEEQARAELLEARTPLYLLVENVYARRRPW